MLGCWSLHPYPDPSIGYWVLLICCCLSLTPERSYSTSCPEMKPPECRKPPRGSAGFSRVVDGLVLL
ncbi:hypothetical protein AOLI_G00186960 [Acnodon oligacanthus]